MNHHGDPSINLGDIIIYQSVRKILDSLFPNYEIIRISSHAPLEMRHFKLIKEAKYTFVGGTNIFSSDIVNGFAQLPIRQNKWKRWILPGVRDIIFLGAGWGVGYNMPMKLRTWIFYKLIMNKRLFHSARDSYSARKMNSLVKIVNTSCPTVWDINKYDVNRLKRHSTCLLTLTDYNQDQDHDSKLIEICLSHFSKIVFFPQGKWDIDYLNTLKVFVNNKNKFHILSHDITEYFQFVDNEEYTYVGTRLHGGIRCMQAGRSAAIIGIDNRAIEMGLDVGLSVINRGDTDSLVRWLNMERIFDKIRLPEDNINKWKSQFA